MTPWRYLFYGSRTNADIELLGRANGHRWQVNLRQVSDGYQETPIPALAKSNGSFLASGEGTLAMLLNPLNVSAAAELLVEVTNKDRPSAEPVRLATLRSSAQGLGLHTQHPLSHADLPGVFAALLSSPLRYTAEVALRFGVLDRENQGERILRIARIIEPSLRRLAVIPRASGEATLYADIGLRELVPLQLMGGGFQSVVAFAVNVAGTRDGIVLVDEIENGVHYSALEQLWQGLHLLCEEMNAQIVATTHSLECVEAARRALPADALLVHRFSKRPDGDSISVRTLDVAALDGARELGIEVR